MEHGQVALGLGFIASIRRRSAEHTDSVGRVTATRTHHGELDAVGDEAHLRRGRVFVMTEAINVGGMT